MPVNPQEFIGKITTSRFPFYNIRKNEMEYKSRPVLIIGSEKNSFPCDFNVLHISTITRKQHISPEYDYELNEKQCRDLNLRSFPSYVRTHKQSTCYSSDVSKKTICDVLNDFPDIYEEIKIIHSQHTEQLF